MEGKRHHELKQIARSMGREVDITKHCLEYSRGPEGVNRDLQHIIFLDANGKRLGSVDKEVNHE